MNLVSSCLLSAICANLQEVSFLPPPPSVAKCTVGYNTVLVSTGTVPGSYILFSSTIYYGAHQISGYFQNFKILYIHTIRTEDGSSISSNCQLLATSN